jgi:hypothetical protein
MICDKYRGKNTGPQCVNKKIPRIMADANWKGFFCREIFGKFIIFSACQ